MFDVVYIVGICEGGKLCGMWWCREVRIVRVFFVLELSSSWFMWFGGILFVLYIMNGFWMYGRWFGDV